MRVRNSQSEQGAVLPFVALCAVVIFGIGAIAIDLGNGWVTRRNLITATDAGARAAAQEFAGGGDGCAAFASQYVLSNTPDAVNIVCDGDPTLQIVTVDADANVETWFAGVFGQGDFDARSSSSVRWGGAISASGLRPIALCRDSEGIEAWLADTSISLTVDVPFFNKDGQPESCNGEGGNNNVEGNWGVLDFDGNGGQTPKDMVNNGYDGEVIAGSPNLTCTNDPASCYPVEPGNITQIKQALNGIVGDVILLPIVNYVVDGTGNNVDFHVIGFARLTIDSLNLTGPASGRSITITFTPGLITGTCCSVTGGPNNATVVQACAVDRESLGNCTN